MKRTIPLSILACVAILLVAPVVSVQAATPPYHVADVVLPDVALRAGVTADLHLTVYATARRPCAGTVFAQHGAWHTAAVWEPLAAALFARTLPGPGPCRVIALDLPGHGRGSLPVGALFGELTLNDYVTAVIATLERLKDLGVRPQTLVGHSLGGMLAQLVQQRLVAADTSLRRAYGVKHAVLRGSANPEPIPSQGVDYAAVFAPFTIYTPELGGQVFFPAPLWRLSMFGNLAGGFGPGAPSAEEIVARGYIEPMSEALVEDFVDRPYVDEGLFSKRLGTTLTVVSFEQDRLVRPVGNEALYLHLTGDGSGRRFVVVPGLYAVHDLFISDPAALLTGMGGLARAF